MKTQNITHALTSSSSSLFNLHYQQLLLVMKKFSCLLLVQFLVSAISEGTSAEWNFPRPEGSVNAVYDLIDRVLKRSGSRNVFHLAVIPAADNASNNQAWFKLEQRHLEQEHYSDDGVNNRNSTTTTRTSSTPKIAITATSVSELTAGVGYYLKEYCNMTIEWSTGGRAGGSHIIIPDIWPVPLHQTNNDDNENTKDTVVVVQRYRTVPWSYLMNVCTHSYSLVWYDWTAWQALIDNLALRGVNMILALTGQEEIQYQVFTKLGMKDEDIRSWFNGPAFLTWSRGERIPILVIVLI